MRSGREKKGEKQSFLIEPLIALTGSLAQPDAAVSDLHKFDIPRQLFVHASKLGPEAIL